MGSKTKNNKGINIRNSSIKVGGDIVGHNKIVNLNKQLLNNQLTEIMYLWEISTKNIVEKTNLSPDEKENIKELIEKIKSTVEIEGGKNPSKIGKLINTLATMSPDIFDVVVATLTDPLAGIGLVIRKVSDRAKVEKQKS